MCAVVVHDDVNVEIGGTLRSISSRNLHKSSPLWGSRPQASLKAGSLRSRSRWFGILVAAGDRKDAGAHNVGHGVRHPRWIARIVDCGGQPVGQLQASLGCGQKHYAHPEVKRPPSNAAGIFLRPTAGNESGSNISSVMAGVARERRWQGWIDNRILRKINRLS